MYPLDDRNRESRFQDACKFAAALVILGMVVVAGESAMRTLPDVVILAAPEAAVAEPDEDVPGRFPIDASTLPEPHVEASDDAAR